MSVILSLMLIFVYTTSAFAATPNIPTKSTPQALANGLPINAIENGYRVETLINTKEKQKIKFTNLKTGEVEYLESFLENGKYSFLSTSKAGKQKIESVDRNTVKITNEDTNEVKYATRKDVPSDSFKTQSQKGHSFRTQSMKIQYSVSDINWIYDSTSYSSIGTQYAQVSVLASVLAFLIGGAVGGVGGLIITFASYLISESIYNLYYMQIDDHGYWRSSDGTQHEAYLWQTYMYLDPGRTIFEKFMTFDTYTYSYN